MEGCSLREAGLRLQARGDLPEQSRFLDQLVSRRKSALPDLPQLPFRLRLSGWHPYLEERGIDWKTAGHFGMAYYGGRGFLHGRVVFPIHNVRGELVAYAGRAVDGSEPRYLFPEAFRKSQVVFNLHRAVQEGVRHTGQAIVVEGLPTLAAREAVFRVHNAPTRKVCLGQRRGPRSLRRFGRITPQNARSLPRLTRLGALHRASATVTRESRPLRCPPTPGDSCAKTRAVGSCH